MDDMVQGAAILADQATQRDVEAAPIRKIGIIGAGQMGSGIAHVVALSGYNVALHDIAKDRVDAALATIDKNLTRQVASGKITEEDKNKALSRISYAGSLRDFADADLVIEAATEDETVKRKIFVALCPFLKPEAIIGTNTSSISITRLAAATDGRPRLAVLPQTEHAPVGEADVHLEAVRVPVARRAGVDQFHEAHAAFHQAPRHEALPGEALRLRAVEAV